MSSPLPRLLSRDSSRIDGAYPWPQVEAEAERRIPLIHFVLFLATLGTTTLAGALQQDVDPLTDTTSLLLGLPFAATLMSILLFHEMGHYLLARVLGVRASLLYLIPGPPSLVGPLRASRRRNSA